MHCLSEAGDKTSTRIVIIKTIDCPLSQHSQVLTRQRTVTVNFAS